MTVTEIKHNEKQNENFEIYVSEHNVNGKKEYSIIYYQINHDTVQDVHPGVFLCKIDQWMHPILQMMMIRSYLNFVLKMNFLLLKKI